MKRHRYNRYRKRTPKSRLLTLGAFIIICVLGAASFPFEESTGTVDAGFKAVASPKTKKAEDQSSSANAAHAEEAAAGSNIHLSEQESEKQYIDILENISEETATAAISESQPQTLARVQPQPALDADAAKAKQEISDPEYCPVPALEYNTSVIKSGETASGILGKYLDPAQIHALAQACKDVYPLSRLRAGQPYALTTLEDEFVKFEYEIDSEERLVVAKSDDGFAVQCEPIVYDIVEHTVSGTVTSSLFEAVTDAGESAELAVRLANIFAWEVDFIRDLRKGDAYQVIVEKRYREGEFSGYGAISAAEFVNQGHTYQGFRFKDSDERYGYFTADGRNLRKAFLKAPLAFNRISSSFTWKRLHPILKIYRPHPGYDYAAPMGTPVKAIGNGVVIAKGWDKGGGRYVKIRHPGNYESIYMHLKGWAKGVAKGVKIDQGQVIAYVGSSGLSTGPHLDFRMKRNGNYIDSRKIENPRAKSLDKNLMPAFSQHVAELQTRFSTSELAAVDKKTADSDGS